METKPCYCPDPNPNAEGTVCEKCEGLDPNVPVKKKRRVKK